MTRTRCCEKLTENNLVVIIVNGNLDQNVLVPDHFVRQVDLDEEILLDCDLNWRLGTNTASWIHGYALNRPRRNTVRECDSYVLSRRICRVHV